MNKFYIVHLRYRLGTHPKTSGAFVYDEDLGAFIYGGRLMGQKEFNAFMRSREWQRLMELESAVNIAPQVLINNMQAAQAGLSESRARKRMAKTSLALVH